ncbi:MAG TPA: hypothetical protein VFX75_02725 [Nitrososphaeraceae archaeon]|nr:hypothetical protein [Nitrososphaeraceae archaeon]
MTSLQLSGITSGGTTSGLSRNTGTNATFFVPNQGITDEELIAATSSWE